MFILKFTGHYTAAHTIAFTVVLSIAIPSIRDWVREIFELCLALGRIMYFG